MSNFTKTAAGREVTLGMQALKRLAQPDAPHPIQHEIDARFPDTLKLCHSAASPNSRRVLATSPIS
jgi:hypothetical protein